VLLGLPVGIEQEREVSPRRVFCGEPDLETVVVGVVHHLQGFGEDLLPRHVELVPDVELRRRDKYAHDVDTRVDRRVHIGLPRPREAAGCGQLSPCAATLLTHLFS